MKKVTKKMLSVMLAFALAITATGEWGLKLSAAETKNVEELTNIENMEENVTYAQMYLDENYIGPIPDMTNLKNIVVSEDNPKYKVVEGALVSKDGKKLYGYPKQKELSEFTVPDTIESIWNGAFAGTKLSKITFTDNIKEIKEGAFALTEIQDVVIPKNVTKINDGTFSGCKKLKTVNLNNVTVIGDNAFKSCELLEKIDLSKIKKIGEYGFSGTGIKLVNLKAGMKLGKMAFDTNVKLNYNKTFTSIKPYLLSYKRWNKITGAKGYQVTIKVIDENAPKNKVYIKSTLKGNKLSKKLQKKVLKVNAKINGSEIINFQVKIRGYKLKKNKKVYTKWSTYRSKYAVVD